MREFILNEPLSLGTIDARRSALIDQIGLSEEGVSTFEKHTSNLCDLDKAQRRMKNLCELGFDSKMIVTKNPVILSRKRATVSDKFYKVQAWLSIIDPTINIHKLLVQRVNLWSVGEKKFFIGCSLACIIGRGVTVGRLCNLLTLSVEDVLLAYIEGAHYDFSVLCFVARKKRKMKSSKEEKNKCIKEHLCLLPHEVCKRYLS